ncbi:MAG: GNAT family N-acetyltransferase, partial [Thermotogaceae bacterium]|nr:GNAT family N-acetyltransferase [Thermotogaceae bacterium]
MRYFLETDKIGLKKLEQLEVTQEYVDWLNDEVVTQTLVAGKLPTGLEDIATYVAGANKPGTITFAIYRKDTAKHIGNVKLDHIDWISRKADFGILLGDKDSWGKGFGFDATKTVIDY